MKKKKRETKYFAVSWGRPKKKRACGLGDALGQLGCAIGQGLLAGLTGTAAITVAQLLEMKITDRKPSNTPEKAGKIVLGVRPINNAKGKRFGNMVHWFYGIIWGIPRGILSLFAIRGIPATFIHFLKIWITGMMILPWMKISSPPWQWSRKALAIDGVLHFVYALGAGVCYDYIHRTKGQGKW
ncbi:MAG: hypothetical protein GF401_16245 [Chitinivibrionales bacterium]|nr:hypothetical protein [Chitinivibrionales bacterium]